MRCLRLHEWGGDLELEDIPVPTVGTHEVLIEVAATSVGRTVHNNISGYMAGSDEPLPLVPGHEIVGEIAQTGDGVTRHRVGDLVTAYYYLNCGYCDRCQRNLEPLCSKTGGRLGVDHDGGFAEFARLPDANVVPLPDMDPLAATVVPDAVGTPVHVVTQRAAIDPGDEVLILGAGGGVGIHLVQVADHFGGAVTAVDLDAAKLDRCRDLGAVRTIDTATESFADRLDADDVTYDAVVDFTGVMDLLEAAVAALGPRGRLVNLTAYQGRSFDLSPRLQVLGEIEVVGSRYCSKYELREAAQLVADGDVEPVITEVVDLAGVPELLESIAADEVVGRGAVTP